ncbi:hypothetical protein BpHYR1_045949 [Brachionus plicatilis]|uniref:Uncharacterized protein n=1 Tax=Brachionus plicatilis TaxID=10195 RepID=A0A3M7T6M2_BRAPC|nr:hypothetical protein BpHYR1_045949 [Brachionus plicatilis]
MTATKLHCVVQCMQGNVDARLSIQDGLKKKERVKRKYAECITETEVEERLKAEVESKKQKNLKLKEKRLKEDKKKQNQENKRIEKEEKKRIREEKKMKN